MHNDPIRERIRTRRSELKDLLALGDSVNRRLMTEFGLSYGMVCYYQKEPGVDRRVKFTAAVLQELSEMTLDDRRRWAERENVGNRSVQDALRRYKKRKNQQVGDNLRQRGYIDFDSGAELRSMGLTPARLRVVRKHLKQIYKLGLEAPNRLTHPPTGRVYLLERQEQHSLLQNPDLFLKFRAEHIRLTWDSVKPLTPAE